MDGIVLDELKKIREDHADARRTVILDQVDEITVEDMIAEEDVAISITHSGYIKRTSISTYRSQRRGGRGRMGMRTKDEDFVDQLFIASTHSYVLIFSDRGRVYWLKVHESRGGTPGKGSRGQPGAARPAGEIAASPGQGFEPTPRPAGTRKGSVKKTDLSLSNRAERHHRPRCGDDDALIEGRAHLGHRRAPAATKEGIATISARRTCGRLGARLRGEGDRVEETDEVWPWRCSPRAAPC